MITVEQYKTAVRSLDGYFGVIGMFGGNPCVHPQFPELCEILREFVPFEQRGLWSNNLNGHGAVIRETFNPRVSNINTHLDQRAYREVKDSWPEIGWPNLKDPSTNSRHSPVYVAMKDMDVLRFPDGSTKPNTEENRWRLISNCDVNQYWSAMIGVFRGELRAWFCEIAGAMSMLHQNDSNYPDTGIELFPGWWRAPIESYDAQIRKHCHECGIPLRGFGELAVEGAKESVSQTHADIYKPKNPNRPVRLVSLSSDLGPSLSKATDYVENSQL